MAVGAVFVGIRLFPLGSRQGVAWETLWPLAASALVAVFETALVLGSPIGFALALSPGVTGSSGESAGGSVSWRREHLVVLKVALLWCVLAAAIGAYGNLRFGAPGRVARGVVAGARAICVERHGQRAEPVPLLGARWICSPTAPPRLTGEWSRNGAVTQYSASGIELSEDLAYIDVTDLELSAAVARGATSLRLTVDGARVRGTWPWAKKSRISAIGRAFYIAGLAALEGLLAALLVERIRARRRFLAPSLAGLGGATAWLALFVLDANAEWFLGSYLLAPLAAALMMLATSSLYLRLWPSERHSTPAG